MTTATLTESLVEACARHAHEVNRAYCAALGDDSHVPWDEAPEWQRDSLRAGARAALAEPTQAPADSHAGWLAHKLADGWTYGPVKDPAAKTHPCIVAYGDLPPAQRAKDHIFRAAVLGMAQAQSAAALDRAVLAIVERDGVSVKNVRAAIASLRDRWPDITDLELVQALEGMCLQGLPLPTPGGHPPR